MTQGWCAGVGAVLGHGGARQDGRTAHPAAPALPAACPLHVPAYLLACQLLAAFVLRFPLCSCSLSSTFNNVRFSSFLCAISGNNAERAELLTKFFPESSSLLMPGLLLASRIERSGMVGLQISLFLLGNTDRPVANAPAMLVHSTDGNGQPPAVGRSVQDLRPQAHEF